MILEADTQLVNEKLNERFNQICLEIEKNAVSFDEDLLRELVDERRFVHASLIEYQANPEKDSVYFHKTKRFLESWTKRIHAFCEPEKLNEHLWNPEFCQVYLDCFVPLIWNWERDWLVLIRPSHEMIVAALLDRGQKHVLIFDPEADLKEYDLFESKTLFIAKTIKEIQDFFHNHKYPIRRVNGLFCNEKPSSFEEQEEINGVLNKAITKHQLNLNTAKVLTKQWIETFIENSLKLSELPHVSEVKIADTDTAILVAPGPSLEKNVRKIRDFKGRALIICVLHALPKLVKEGIVPDVVIHIDSKPDQELVDHLISHMNFEIPLLIVSTSLPQHYLKIPARQIAWSEVSGSIHFELCDALDLKFPHLSGGNVSLYAFNLCAAWNIKNIALVGHDLSYKDGQYYVDTDGLGNAISIKNTVNTEYLEVPGYYGDTVKTSADFSLFIEQFKLWSETPIHKDSRLFNCTEGGASIEGFKQLPLESLLLDVSKYPKNMRFEVNFDKNRQAQVKLLFKKFFENYLEETKEFLGHVNSCAKISSIKIPSQKQVEKRKLAETELKRISGKNKLLESYLVRLITETNLGNGGILNTVTSQNFYTKLRKEVFRFRSQLVKYI